jgi:Skp family chaperone for outer membrane proteins
MAKVLLIVAILVSLLTAGIGYVNKQTLVETVATLDTTKSSLATRTTELTGKTKELEETTASLETTTAEKQTAEASLATTEAALDKSESELTDVKGQVATKDGEIQSLNDQIKEKDVTIAQLTVPGTTPSDATASTGPTPREQELEALVASLEEKNTELRSENETFTKKEDDRKQMVMRDGLEGQVLAVNPAWNFVVLSIGDNRGVVNNAELLLKRDGRYLGKVRVTSVEPSTSIADIVANSVPAGIAVQPGDRVIYQSSN